MARWVRINEGPGAWTFAFVALIALMVIGPLVLLAMPIAAALWLIGKVRNGATPAGIIGPIVTLAIVCALYAVIR